MGLFHDPPPERFPCDTCGKTYIKRELYQVEGKGDLCWRCRYRWMDALEAAAAAAAPAANSKRGKIAADPNQGRLM